MNTSVGSAYTAGGIIGENNFSVISENTMDGVSVYGGCEYAGHIAGIWRSTCCVAKDNYIANARTATDTGTADIAPDMQKSRMFMMVSMRQSWFVQTITTRK